MVELYGQKSAKKFGYPKWMAPKWVLLILRECLIVADVYFIKTLFFNILIFKDLKEKRNPASFYGVCFYVPNVAGKFTLNWFLK